MKTKIGIIFLFVLLTGCAAQNTFNMKQYQSSGKAAYPPISIMVNDGYVYTDSGCNQYSCYNYADNTHLFILNSLRQSNLFERIDLNNAYSEYRLEIGFTQKSNGSEAGDFTKIMLGALTLFMIPMSYEYTYKAGFTLIHKDKVIAKYEYDRVSNEIKSIFIEPQSAKNNAVKSIVNNFLYDLENDNRFQPDPEDTGGISL